jgi:hypothetical protein
MSAHPGEVQGVRVCVDEVEHRLEQLEMGDGRGGNGTGVRKEGEAKPAISLHGEQAAVGEPQDVAGVSMDVQGDAGPGLEGEEDGTELS